MAEIADTAKNLAAGAVTGGAAGAGKAALASATTKEGRQGLLKIAAAVAGGALAAVLLPVLLITAMVSSLLGMSGGDMQAEQTTHVSGVQTNLGIGVDDQGQIVSASDKAAMQWYVVMAIYHVQQKSYAQGAGPYRANGPDVKGCDSPALQTQPRPKTDDDLYGWSLWVAVCMHNLVKADGGDPSIDIGTGLVPDFGAKTWATTDAFVTTIQTPYLAALNTLSSDLAGTGFTAGQDPGADDSWASQVLDYAIRIKLDMLLPEGGCGTGMLTLRVLTFNLLANSLGKGADWKTSRGPAAANWIRAANPDILMFQEDWTMPGTKKRQSSIVLDHLDGRYTSVDVGSPRTIAVRNGLVSVMKSPAGKDLVGQIALSHYSVKQNGFSAVKQAAWAQVSTASGSAMLAVSVHLTVDTPPASHATMVAYRTEEIRKLLAGIDALGTNLPVVIGGDFNTPSRSSAAGDKALFKLLSDAGYTLMEAGTNLSAWPGAVSGGRGTGTKVKTTKSGNIDQIWVRGGSVLDWQVVLSPVITDKGQITGVAPSDHNPVMATVVTTGAADIGHGLTLSASSNSADRVQMSAGQIGYAKTIVQKGQDMGVTPNGIQAALATGFVETRFLNLASQGVPESQQYPNDGVVPGDHDSVGLFQQRAGWGSVKNRMDVGYAAESFFGGRPGVPGVLNVKGYETMSVGALAQKIQVSAFPDRYADWAAAAQQLYTYITRLSCDAAGQSGADAASGASLDGIDPSTLPPANRGAEKSLWTQDTINVSRIVWHFYGDFFSSFGTRVSPDKWSCHPASAIDMMIPHYKNPATRAKGQAIAMWLMRNHKALKITQIIYYDHIWTVKTDKTDKPYSNWRKYGNPHAPDGSGGDTLQHRDHIHVSIDGPKFKGGTGKCA